MLMKIINMEKHFIMQMQLVKWSSNEFEEHFKSFLALGSWSIKINLLTRLLYCFKIDDTREIALTYEGVGTLIFIYRSKD